MSSRTISNTNDESFPDLSDDNDTTTLYIRDSPELTRFTTLPSMLTRLYIKICESLEYIPDLPVNLQIFDIEDCGSLRRIPDLPHDLESFTVTNLESLTAISNLPPNLRLFGISGCPLAMIQELPKSLAYFVCDLDQLDELCKNNTFLESIMYLLERRNLVILRPGKEEQIEEEKELFTEKIREIIRYKQDTESALEVSLHSASRANRHKRVTRVFDVFGRKIYGNLNPYDDSFNQYLNDNVKQKGQFIVHNRQGSVQGSNKRSRSNSNVEARGRKSKKQKRSRKYKRRKHKYTKKRRRITRK
jgi:small nuclear ribonucleoprotein (snRNP)-like protein